MDATEVTEKCLEILMGHCDSASSEIRKHGEIMIKIADELEGKSPTEALSILEAAQSLLMIRHRK